MEMESLEVDNPTFINDSLCSYYKHLWSSAREFGPIQFGPHYLGVKRFRENKRENSKPITVSHITDLKKRFPDNELLKNEEPKSNQ